MIEKQMIYLGPRLHAFGIGYGNVFHNGRPQQLKDAIAQCPAVGALLVAIKHTGHIRRELNFDYAHNMRGKHGKHVIAYLAIQDWLMGQSSSREKQPSTRNITSHA